MTFKVACVQNSATPDVERDIELRNLNHGLLARAELLLELVEVVVAQQLAELGRRLGQEEAASMATRRDTAGGRIWSR